MFLIDVFLAKNILGIFLKFEFYFRVDDILGMGGHDFCYKNVPLNEMCKARQTSIELYCNNAEKENLYISFTFNFTIHIC